MNEIGRVLPPVETYGTPEHAAAEALNRSTAAFEGYVNSDVERVAELVIEGLRERGFIVTNQPRCECGWTGIANHLHDDRMGRSSDVR